MWPWSKKKSSAGNEEKTRSAQASEGPAPSPEKPLPALQNAQNRLSEYVPVSAAGRKIQSKRQENEGTTSDQAVSTDCVGEPVVEPQAMSIDKIGDAIIALRGNGAHFCISYAQMNGYNEKLNNPSRWGEIVMATSAEPNFTESGIDFSVQCQLEELDSFARNPEGLTHTISGFQSASLQRLQQEQDSQRWAREIMADIRRLGKGSLRAGFEEVGFDFRTFLVDTVVSRRQADLQKILIEVESRKDVLKPLFLRAYSRGRNKYGEIEFGPLFDEIHDFFKTFFPEGTLKFFFLAPPVSVVANLALSWIGDVATDEEKPGDGIDFEHWCARKIEQQGWIVAVSKASGDQGVDVIASRDSISVVVQCKRYNTPIGNKAVQEAFTGARYYNADLAVVVGTGGFTKAAQELARSTNVILLDAEMIGDFSAQVISRL